jgi:hypothetical protein
MIKITDEGRRLAAELANVERVRKGGKAAWTAEAFSEDGPSDGVALARLCTRFLAMEADMREIDRLATKGLPSYKLACDEIQAIAAKRRIVDPLLIEAREIVAVWAEANPKFGVGSNSPESLRAGKADNHPEVEQALAALKRGIELGEAK